MAKKKETKEKEKTETSPKKTDKDTKKVKAPEKKEIKETQESEINKKTEKETKKLTKEEMDKKKKELLERAKKMSEKVEGTKTEDIKDKVKIKKRTDMLIPLEDYVKSGIYIGTRAVTPNMKKYVYRRRADGLAIFNTDIIDEKLKEGIEYLNKYNPEDIILICKREAGWKVAEMFGKLTGIRIFTKKYPAGILTNTSLPRFFENKLTIITDAWIDKNALNDTLNVKKDVLMICDTNNFTKGASKIIIGNNKSEKSIGLIYYLLARGFMKSKNMDMSKLPGLEWWTSEDK